MLQDGLHLDLQWNSIHIFFFFKRLISRMQSERKVVKEPTVPLKKGTVFDQSLIPQSAVVKDYDLEKCLALIWKADIRGRGLVESGG